MTENEGNRFDFISIEPDRDGGPGVEVIGYGVYPKSSVLAGQTRRAFLDCFDSEEAAKREYPTARVGGGAPAADAFVPSVAPDWFDPEAAGERWDDDY